MILQQADTEFGKPVMADLALTGLCQAHGAEAKRLDHNAGFCTPQPDATGDDRMLCLGVSAPPASGKPFAMSSAPSAARNWSAPPTVVASSTSQVTTVRSRIQPSSGGCPPLSSACCRGMRISCMSLYTPKKWATAPAYGGFR